MIEILPNWHPLFVHFPIALLSMATLFFVALNFVKKVEVQEQLKILAYWNLWLGTGFAIVTVIAGWFAYNSVAHDTPSHEAMTEHRNLALITVAIYIVINYWAWRIFKSKKTPPLIFTLASVVAFSMLVSTGWHGSEAVYRYGLGVMSLPQVEGEDHVHEHHDDTDHDTHMSTEQHENMPTEIQAPDANTAAPVENHPIHDHSQHKHAN